MRTCLMGIDVGGTKTAAGLVMPDTGHIIKKRIVPTDTESDGKKLLEKTRHLAEKLLEDAKQLNFKVMGIGIAVAELVSLDGVVQSDNLIAWRDLPVQTFFESLAPTVLEADVRAAALAEAMLGAGKPYRQFVYISVGTGISSCLVIDGKPFKGARGNALIMASSPQLIINEHGTSPGVVLESFASGPALLERYYVKTTKRVGHGKDILKAAERGDAAARAIVRTAAEALANKTAWIIDVLDPEAVVVGGGLGSAEGFYWDVFREAVYTCVWAEQSQDVTIVQASAGSDSALIGAALTALPLAV